MGRFLLFGLIILSACNGPSPHFRGIPATRIAVDGSVFDVRIRGNLAEAIRINAQYAPRFGPIRDRAGSAMALVSGCRVTSVLGDQALATGTLQCRTRSAPGEAPGPNCRRVAQSVAAGSRPAYPEFVCQPARSAQ